MNLSSPSSPLPDYPAPLPPGRALNQIPLLEPGCMAMTETRKYYHLPATASFVKRSLRPDEASELDPGSAHSIMMRMSGPCLLNEADCLAYVREKTTVPVPRVYASFQDGGATYLVTEFVPGVQMASLKGEEKQVVTRELEGYIGQLHSLKSKRLGGPGGQVVPPWRVLAATRRELWDVEDIGTEEDGEEGPEAVFCHGDLSQKNVLVGEETLKITGIIDWEFGGFWPSWFEGRFWERPGPSVALRGEESDVGEMTSWLQGRIRGLL